MNKNGKNTDFPAPFQNVAGVLPCDGNIEFIGVPETKGVIWMQHGNSHYFQDLDEKVYKKLERQYRKDKIAKSIFQPMGLPMAEQVELYTYYLYGELDTTPDYSNGKLAPSENWRHTEDCISLGFDSKNITIGETVLNWREIRIIDMIKKEFLNSHIATELGITESTINTHLKNLYRKAGVQTKAGLINIVNQEKI